MDFKEFWDNELDKDITTISDTVIKIFSEPLEDEIYENYDLVEILCEFTGHHKTEKKYDKIEEFGAVVKQHQPKLYNSVGGYVIRALVEYYCFTGEVEKLKSTFNDYTTIDLDYDLLLESLQFVAYHQYIDLVNEMIDQIYDKVKNDPDLMHGAEFELDYLKYYIELERLFNKQKNATTPIDCSNFQQVLNAYNFEIEDEHLKRIEIGLFDNSAKPLEFLRKELNLKEDDYNKVLSFRFLKFMHSKNCSFSTSGLIWSSLQGYFKEINLKKRSNFFVFKTASLKKYIKSKSNFWSENNLVKVMIILGSHYINDFAFQQNFIAEKDYLKQYKVIENIKKEFKIEKKIHLWKFSFVHQWLPHANINSEQWEEEKNTFKSSYELIIETKNYNFLKTLKALDNDEPIAEPEYIGQTPELEPELEPERTYEIVSNSDEPYVNHTKIGRNEKVSVQYKDGTIKKDVKYKKIMNDVNSGTCEIINHHIN